MTRTVPFVGCLLAASIVAAAAQEVTEPPAPAAAPDAPKTMIGSWEFSNADREKTCTITFRNDATAVGKKVEFDGKCAGHFPFIRDIAGWSQTENDFLRLIDAKGQSVLVFSEVESGIFEAPRQGEGILFIQNAAAAGPAPRSPEQVAGDWTMTRAGGRPLCALTLSNTAAGEEFMVRVGSPCDAAVTRFGPATWQMDRGELVLRSARGQTWRFEAVDETNWRRIPETRDAMQLIRK